MPKACGAPATGSGDCRPVVVTAPDDWLARNSVAPQVSRRLVVFTGNPSFSVLKGIVDLDLALPGLQWLVVWHSPHKSVTTLLKSQRVNLKRNGWRWVPYQLSDIVARATTSAAPYLPDHLPGSEYSLDAVRSRPNLRLLRVSDLHQQDTLAEVRRFEPDLGLSLAAPILRRELFSLPKLGTLNLHKGKLPEFRGMPPAFWEFWYDQDDVGCTVHWVDENLDTGKVVASTGVKRSVHSTVKGIQLQLDEAGVVLMSRAVGDVLKGESQSTNQAPYTGKTHRKPTLAQVSEMKRREVHFAERATSAVQPQRWLRRSKDLAASVCWAGMHRVGRRALTPRVTVLLYHRVSDDVRDNLTVGIAQFDQHMALLRRRCNLISVEQLLTMDSVPHSDLPLVAVTFDDGYLDNYSHAAPILRRHRVPAAFFVSTGIIGSEQQFPHDVRRGNPRIPVMNWDQLREMRRWGFMIGSHTVNHVDCAAESADLVWAELKQSRDDLRRELELDEVVLAYPYGGRQHMNTERLGMVRAAGYIGCLSAYGGVNIGRVDPFNVLRRGIHCEFSAASLLYQSLGLS